MKYWNDFNSKYGFNDGEAIPPDAECQREVYVTILNALAEKFNSSIRFAKYDRPGMHNYCMILIVPKEDLVEGNEASERYLKSAEKEPMLDEGAQKAIELAQYRGLDWMVKVSAKIDKKTLRAVLKDLDKEFEIGEEINA